MLGALRSNARWIAIGGLILVNLALIAALIVRHTASATSVVPAAIPAVTTSPHAGTTGGGATATPKPSAARSPGSVDESLPGNRSTTRLLTANSAEIAWRAERGGCGQRSAVEVTTNGGKSWRQVDAGLRGIVRLQAYGDRSVFAIGADAACRPKYTSTQSPDRRWHSAPAVWDSWFSYPNDPSRVHAPGGRTSRPCGDSVRAFSATSTAGAAVLCGDGRVRTSATGRTWRTLRSDPTSVTLGSSDRALLIARPSRSCDAVIVRSVDATPDASRQADTGCPARLGPVAVAGHGSVRWHWVGSYTGVG